MFTMVVHSIWSPWLFIVYVHHGCAQYMFTVVVHNISSLNMFTMCLHHFSSTRVLTMWVHHICSICGNCVCSLSSQCRLTIHAHHVFTMYVHSACLACAFTVQAHHILYTACSPHHHHILSHCQHDQPMYNNTCSFTCPPNRQPVPEWRPGNRQHCAYTTKYTQRTREQHPLNVNNAHWTWTTSEKHTLPLPEPGYQAVVHPLHIRQYLLHQLFRHSEQIGKCVL